MTEFWTVKLPGFTGFLTDPRAFCVAEFSWVSIFSSFYFSQIKCKPLFLFFSSWLQRHGGRPGPHTDVTEECYFCGTVDGDDANHYFVSCEVALGLVIAARAYFGLPGTDRQRLGEQVVRRLLGPEPTTIAMELLDAAPPDDLIGTVLGRRVVPALESGVQCLITYEV